MGEEYRMQKAQGDINKVATTVNGNTDSEAEHAVIYEDGTVAPSKRDSALSEGTTMAHIDDNASTRGMVSPTAKASSTTDINGLPLDNSNSIPTIRVSTESDRDEEAPANGDVKQGDVTDMPEKPIQAAASEGEQTDGESTPIAAQEPFSFSNKRLCERWLDNLFMVLYEDLRVWTIFRAEVAHFKTQHVAYRKTGLEWEILGDLGLRLHHKEEAKEAYQRCLDTPRYSYKPWAKLMDTYADEGDIQRSIQTAIRVAAYQYAEYTEMTYPTQIARSFFKLGQIHGHAKISFTLMSMGLPEPILKIMRGYLHYGEIFKVEGYDF